MKSEQNLKKALAVCAVGVLIGTADGATSAKILPQVPPSAVSVHPIIPINPCGILGPKGTNYSIFTTHFKNKTAQFLFYSNCNPSTISITNLTPVANKPNQYTFTLSATCKTYTTTTNKTTDSKKYTETHCTTYHYNNNYTANTWIDSLPCTITCGANNSVTLAIPGNIKITTGNDGSFNNNHKLRK